MTIAEFVFSEQSPSSQTTAASSNPVTGGQGSGWPAGVAAPLDHFCALNIVAELVGFSDRMRLVMVAGSGTTQGAPVVVKVFAQTDINYRS